jgi:hypothetical protein
LRDPPLLSLVSLFSISFISLYRVSSLVCLELSIASPRSPCLPTTPNVPSSTEPDRAGQPGTNPKNQMSPTGSKAKATKSPTPKRAPSAGRVPARSPIDDGMRSQMFNLPTSLQYRSRRSNSPLLLGLADPPPKKRKAKVSFENTSASAADKSPSAEDTTISTSAVVKSSSAEDTPAQPLGIRLSDAVDQRLQQLSSSKFPEKEHSALDGDKGPSLALKAGTLPLQHTRAQEPVLHGVMLMMRKKRSLPKLMVRTHLLQLCALRAYGITVKQV